MQFSRRSSRSSHLAVALLLVTALLLAACGAPAQNASAPPAGQAASGGQATPGTLPQAGQSQATPGGAASGAQQTGNRVELNFWGGWTGPDRDVMAKMVDEYNTSQSKVHVTLTTQQWTPLFDKFVLSVRSKSVPDLLAMHGPDIPQFASQGVLEPLDDVVSKAGLKQGDFATTAWNGTVYQGKQYAFPLDLHMHAVYYNADMFAKAKVTPPTDWVNKDDFLKMVTALTVDKNGKHSGEDGFDAKNVQQYGLAMYNNHHGFYMFYALLKQQGQDLLGKDDKTVAYSQDAGTAAWTWLQDLVFKYHAVPSGETNPLQDFLSGRTAMLIDGPWQIPAMAKQSGLKWGTFPVPQVFTQRATWGSGHVLTVPVQADKSREAAAEELAQWIVQHSATWGSSGNIPALSKARQSSEFTSLPGRDGFVKSLDNEVMLPAIPAEAQVFSSAATSPIVIASQQILVQDKPIPAAMKTMNDGIDGILASQ